MKQSFFEEQYNLANKIGIKTDLDIYDECYFSYLDILKEKEVEVLVKGYVECECMKPSDFNLYYEKCDKCNGEGKIVFNKQEVICNRCLGKKRHIKEVCSLCLGEGEILKKRKLKVKLNRYIKDNEIIEVKNAGRINGDFKGDLYIRVKVRDLNCFIVKGNDIYDRRMIEFSKEEIRKGTVKKVETIKKIHEIKSSGKEKIEILEFKNEGIDTGNFYVSLRNELVEIKGEDVYKNVILKKGELNFYILYTDLTSDKKFIDVNYYKKIDDVQEYYYLELEQANNFKVVKVKNKGLKGYNDGENGDLYLRIFYDNEFKVVEDTLYYKPIKLFKHEVSEGKKNIVIDSEKISLSFSKDLKEEKEIVIKDYGPIVSKNVFNELHFILNPLEKEIFRISVKVMKNMKVIYINDYKKYFYELVKVSRQEKGNLKVKINKNDSVTTYDEENNKVIIRIIR